MQIQLQAFGRKTVSLRKLITDDLSSHEHELLYVEAFKNPERASGWAKIKGYGLAGAINIKWEVSSRMLTARAIAKQGNSPHQLLGAFMAYIVERFGSRISSINIQLR
jgi:hypothetical protein